MLGFYLVEVEGAEPYHGLVEEGVGHHLFSWVVEEEPDHLIWKEEEAVFDWQCLLDLWLLVVVAELKTRIFHF